MEAVSPHNVLECGICLNICSPWRRAKLLECGHSCCSFCLRQMTMACGQIQLGANHINQYEMGANHIEATTDQNEMGANPIQLTTEQHEMGTNWSEATSDRNEIGASLITELRTSCVIRCPWCRQHTPLPASLSISHLPDDPEKMSAVTTAASQRVLLTSVFVGMVPSTTCFLFPSPGGRSQAGEGQEVSMPGMTLPQEQAGGCVLWERELRGVRKAWGEGERGFLEDEEAGMNTLGTKMCAVVVVGVALVFFVCFCLTMVNCNSTRFRMISCS